jgi:hypothetical protein
MRLVSDIPWAVASEPEIATQTARREYHELTNQLLSTGIEVERYTLKYRLRSITEPKYRKTLFFLAQEAGASGILTFQIVSDKEFGLGRRHPLKISKDALHGALATSLATSVVAGSSSLAALASNSVLAIRSRQLGYGPRAADDFVFGKLAQFDKLLEQRDAIAKASFEGVAYKRAVAESKVMRDLRAAFVNEYTYFRSDARNFATFQNSFFLLNAATNAIGSTASGIAYDAVNRPKLNGPANILFIVTGSLFMSSPLIAATIASMAKQRVRRLISNRAGDKEPFSQEQLTHDRKQLDELIEAKDDALPPSANAVARSAIFTESDRLFQKQINSEVRVTRHLEKVAVENCVMGPAIGSTLMTQGVLGTTGYYKYTFKPRKQITYSYHGSVVGTAGAALAVGGTLAWYVMSTEYEQRLRREHRLPSQLINDRLAHIDDLEKTVQGMN